MRRQERKAGTRARTAALDLPQFQQPARFVYSYRSKWVGWFLEEHAYVRELLYHVWPRFIRRELLVTERIAEIPFVLHFLQLPPGRRVLDVGSRWSLLPLHLAAMGYRTVATDLVALPIRGSGPDVCRADLRKPPFRPASFDGVVIVSTLEHIGLGWYDERKGEADDFRVMRELRSLLKPGGVLLLTVPFGRGGQGPKQRAYDGQRLRRLLEGWIVDGLRFYVRRRAEWRETAEEEASQTDSAVETRGVAMVILRRP